MHFLKLFSNWCFWINNEREYIGHSRQFECAVDITLHITEPMGENQYMAGVFELGRALCILNSPPT